MQHQNKTMIDVTEFITEYLKEYETLPENLDVMLCYLFDAIVALYAKAEQIGYEAGLKDAQKSIGS